MEMESQAKSFGHEIFQETVEEQQHFSYAMQLVGSVSLPMVLMAAVRLGLLEIIAGAGPGAQLSPSEIAARLPWITKSHRKNADDDNEIRNPNAAAMLDRMMYLLASHSVLTCSSVDGDARSRRVYGLAPVAKYFVRNEKGASLGHVLESLQDKVFIESWYELEDAVVEGGIPFNRVHGTHAFDYLGRDPRLNEVFNKAMVSHTTMVIDRILESNYEGFESMQTLVDVAGGLGVTLNAITSKYPNLKGINFDLPHVIQHAPAYPGVKHIAGDMFESVPSGDAIFLKWILHDWDDDHCLKLLKNCYKALPGNGKVIVVDAVAPVIPDTSMSAKTIGQFDMVMMTESPGGKERNEEEFHNVALAAGFQGIRMECFVCNLWVMEFYK